MNRSAAHGGAPATFGGPAGMGDLSYLHGDLSPPAVE